MSDQAKTYLSFVRLRKTAKDLELMARELRSVADTIIGAMAEFESHNTEVSMVGLGGAGVKGLEIERLLERFIQQREALGDERDVVRGKVGMALGVPVYSAHHGLYPHFGGCEGCREAKLCNVCGAESLFCTNGRCAQCHLGACGPGGDTSPGHGYGPAERAAKFTAKRKTQ